jgi:phosphatidate phosphatase APP1
MRGRRVARSLEAVTERILHREGPPVLTPHAGYAEPDALVLQGRVLSAVTRDAPDADQSRWRNVRQMVSLFLTSEVAAMPVTAAGVTAMTDSEGYLTLRVPREGARAGWHGVPARIPGGDPVDMPVLVPRADAEFGVISDIDDTMMMTGAYSIGRNLWTTFTGNALTRRVFADASALMERLHRGGRNPVFYVSSSPWNLHDFLTKVFARAGLPRGPLFLRDLGVSGSGPLGASHRDHKGAALRRVLAANPGLRFFLLGDTGQKDAFVYRDAVRACPGRIAAVLLREPVAGSARASLSALLEIERMGVPTWHGRSFAEAPGRALPGVAP